MAALTTDTSLFGATPGVSCPSVNMKMVDYTRDVDIAAVKGVLSNGAVGIAGNANYDLLPIPRGFLVHAIALEQTGYTDQAVTLTFATKNDPTAALGGNFALVATGTLLRSCQAASIGSADSGESTVAVPGEYFSAQADTLCVKVPSGLTNSKLVKGKFTVHLIGFQTFGESLDDVASGTPDWANGQTATQAADNVSGGDPKYR